MWHLLTRTLVPRPGLLQRLSRSAVTLTKLEDAKTAGVAVLKLDRAEAKNALSRAMLEELQRQTDVLERDTSLRCAILASASSGIFCAGADLKERLEMSVEEAARAVSGLQATFERFARLPVPTIAVLEGPALGGGAELALACDIRIGGRGVRFAFPETRLAILPGAGGTQRLPRLVGPATAKELIFTGRAVDAEESLQLGLLNRLSDDPMKEARQLATQICAGGPVGVRMAKRAIDDGQDKSMQKALEIETACYRETLTTEDRLEGLRAFKEKRKPEFQGR